MRIIEQLGVLAGLWADASNRSLATLATKVVNDGGFFGRIGEGGRDCSTGTFEKFLLFFRDGANWPDGRIPLAAAELLDRFDHVMAEAASEGMDSEAAAEPSPDAEADPVPCVSQRDAA